MAGVLIAKAFTFLCSSHPAIAIAIDRSRDQEYCKEKSDCNIFCENYFKVYLKLLFNIFSNHGKQKVN